ncbi:FAD binding domain-containing protein [Halococcus agarilyticus]|uniref:FAD binding domain-containing protein n=1 Tax=Halococcus agarilyticus TaxID=1232219 RepID=UPI00067804F1|nr:FAD binding domain-containing protein [Halococcus agarilyticus]
MKPAAFQYHQPSSVAEATDLLAEYEHDAELMAGNQSLGIVMANRLATPAHIVDLNGVDDLDYVDVAAERVAIGALTSHRTIETSGALADALPMFPAAAEQIAGPSVRNLGTIGGSVGEADPAGNYPTVLTALDGDLHIASADGERTVAASEYFIAYMFTDLAEDELITGVSVDRGPFPVDRTGMAFLEQKPAAQTWPTISAAAAVRVDDPDASAPVVEEARLALANAADVPLRVEDAEAAVEGESLGEEPLTAAAEAASEAAEPGEEMHADAAYKEELAGEYTRRSLETAYERATDAADTTETTTS